MKGPGLSVCRHRLKNENIHYLLFRGVLKSGASDHAAAVKDTNARTGSILWSGRIPYSVCGSG